MEHILVVEDDPSISEWISDYLTGHGYEVSVANRGDVAVELIAEDQPDLVLLDILLPEKNGFEVCQEVRGFYKAPILMITACGEEQDEVKGLELGADDYVTKPVRLRALLARIQSLLRREVAEDGKLPALEFGNARIDSVTRTATIDDKEIKLSSNEFDLLWLLASQPGVVVSRDELVKDLRGFDYDGFDRTVDIRVSRLRKKLNDLSSCPYSIKTVWSKGYLFVNNEAS
ncbi:UNVERIFIED_CONTAM: hypothetical protein GTU68_043201 [Idotea baltica]|nr:hypothetical protein [Idotea baltica]